MPATPTTAGAASLAHNRKPQSLLAIFKSLGMSGLKVFCGYFVLVALVTAVHFPYQVDELGAPKVRKEAGAFYAGIYSAPAPEVPVSEEDSKYVKMAREAVVNERIVPKITVFANQYGLGGKKVLDVGAGTGYLQDVV